MLRQLNKALKVYFGYDRLRDRQIPLVTKIAQGVNCLGLMQTSGGKSICFQLPALMDGKLTVVISPLLSLIHDQVRELKNKRLPAEMITGATPGKERQAIMASIRAGRVNLLYVSPELFATTQFAQQFNELSPIARIVFDESHCISSWGEDFRPGYLRAVEMSHRLCRIYTEYSISAPQLVAVTASATPEVQSSICKLLKIEDDNIISESVARDNLSFNVVPVATKSDRKKQLLNILSGHEGEPVVIYANSRKTVNELNGFLLMNGFNSAAYHAGLPGSQRTQQQNEFLHDELDVMVATTAFGMGVNKPNIRAVIHYDCPRTIEDYYQQAGRAGRDTDPAYCYLLFNGKNEFNALNNMLAYSHPVGEEAHRCYEFLLALQSQEPGQPIAVSTSVVSKALNISEGKINSIMNFLERQRIAIPAEQGILIRTLKKANWAIIDKLLDYRTAKANEMMAYARSSGCRQLAIMRYFGEKDGQQCGTCDNCREERIYARADNPHQASVLKAGITRAVNEIAKGLRIPPAAVMEPQTIRQLAIKPPTTRVELQALTRLNDLTFELKGRPLLLALENAGHSLDTDKSQGAPQAEPPLTSTHGDGCRYGHSAG